MADELLETYIRQLLESHRAPEVTIAWQGGEPTLMGLDFFRLSVEYAEKYCKPGQQIAYTIQTNGTLIDDEWCAFFKKHGFLVGLSVDGPRELHDTYRVTKGGRGSFDQVMRGWEFLVKHRVDFNILCTLHDANADYPLEVYRFFRDELKTKFIQFIPIVERATPEMLPLANLGWSERNGGDRPLYVQEGNLVAERSVSPEQYGRFMCGVYDEWVRHDVGTVYVQAFDVALGSWVGQHSLCILATCGSTVALEHNGDLYSCDHLQKPKTFLESAETHRGLLASPQQLNLDKAGLDTCLAIVASATCALPHGCRRIDFSPHRWPAGLHYLCAGYKMFFHRIAEGMNFMAAQLQRPDGVPSRVMRYMAQKDAQFREDAFARAGRNDPCPCESGKKFKHCHLIAREVARA
jgi:uncharacterized protein